MVSFPPCKINLGLNIIRKREDGFHDIETCFYPLPFTDVLEVIPADGFGFSTSGIEIPGRADDNLCVRAYHMLKSEGDIPTAAKIHLHKIIPAGAGLGGGSSDAGHCLRLLNAVFSLNLSPGQLGGYASKLGSDCAFFIHDSPMIGMGRGEILTPVEVPLSGKFIILLNPGIHVSTAAAFAGVKPAAPEIGIMELIQKPISEWRNVLVNDFEPTVFARFPAIQTIKERLYAAGALYAAMSGSGSTVFGIFSNPVDVSELFEKNVLLWKGVLS